MLSSCNTNKTGGTLKGGNGALCFSLQHCMIHFLQAVRRNHLSFAEITPQVAEHCGFAAAQPSGDQGNSHTQWPLRALAECEPTCTCVLLPAKQPAFFAGKCVRVQLTGDINTVKSTKCTVLQESYGPYHHQHDWEPNLVLYVSWNLLLWCLLQKHHHPVRYINIKMHASTQGKSLMMRSEQKLTLDLIILEVVSNLNDSTTWKYGFFFLHQCQFNPIKDTTFTYKLLWLQVFQNSSRALVLAWFTYILVYMENSVIESQKNKDIFFHPFQLHY